MDVVAADPGDEALLLDLLNTTPVVDGVPRDELMEPKAARAWMRRHGIAPSGTELAALVTVRAVLQAVVRGEQVPSALRPFVDGIALRPVVAGGGLDWQLVVGGAAQGALRAVLAWDELRISSPGRLRPCANTECRLFLIDRSKPNTARWCSMATCGNRIKARRHYRRVRSTSTDGGPYDAEDA